MEQNNFVIGSIGQTVDVNVWLRQSDPDTVLTDEGLYSAGVKLTYGSPGIAEVLSVLDITPNPAFDDPDALLKDVGSDYSTLDMAVLDMFNPGLPAVVHAGSHLAGDVHVHWPQSRQCTDHGDGQSRCGQYPHRSRHSVGFADRERSSHDQSQFPSQVGWSCLPDLRWLPARTSGVAADTPIESGPRHPSRPSPCSLPAPMYWCNTPPFWHSIICGAARSLQPFVIA